MTVGAAFRTGLGRLRRAPALVVGLWLTTFLLAWPPALLLRGMLADHLGESVAAEAAAIAVNHDWWNEFLAQTAGLGQTFVPAILGFAAVLKNIGSIADAQSVPSAVAGIIAAYLVVTVFLMGGVLDRLARDRRVGSFGFFAACGTYFFRLIRLSIASGVLYWWLFASVHPWLFDRLFQTLTRNVNVERTAVVYRALLYLTFALLLIAVNLVFDYARIRMVVEDRRSAIGALTSALRFISRNTGAVCGLYTLNLLVLAAVIAAYALVAPGAAGGFAVWIGFFTGQLYVTLRIAVRLLFAASQLTLFQGRLAHAQYTAAPVARWPDAPVVEAITPR